jgi:hypothetical protein
MCGHRDTTAFGKRCQSQIAHFRAALRHCNGFVTNILPAVIAPIDHIFWFSFLRWRAQK